jgi:putative membrane protein
MSIKYLLSAGLMAALFVGGPVMAQNRSAKTFLKEAIQGNLAEVQMGELAQKNGASEKVKSFGETLAKDHSEANQKAMQAAESAGVTPPTAPNAKQKAEHDKLAKLSGAKFDREFAQAMVKDHKKDISEYQKAAKMNGPAGTYAKEALPTLKEHLQAAQSLTQPATTGKR